MAKVIVDNHSFNINNKENGIHIDDHKVVYDLLKTNKNEYHLILNHQSYQIKILNKDTYTGQLTLKINGRTIKTKLQNKLADLLKSMGMDAGKKKLKELKAPMPGLVLDILVASDDPVTEGQELIILEAMKMENAIKSPQDGIIEKINVTKNDKIDKNHTLLSFK